MAVDTTPERQDGEDEAGARVIGAQHPPSAPSLATYDVCQSTDGQGGMRKFEFLSRLSWVGRRLHALAVVRLELTIPRCAFISQ